MLVRYAVIGLLAGIAPAKAQIVHEDLSTSSVKVAIISQSRFWHRAALRLQWPGG